MRLSMLRDSLSWAERFGGQALLRVFIRAAKSVAVA